MRIAVIGGTGLAGIESRATEGQVVFLDRHEGVPAHRIDHAARFARLAEQGIDAVLAINNVGGLVPDVRPGDIVIPDDLFDRVSGATIMDEGIVHVSMAPPFCPHLRGALIEGFAGWGRLRPSGTYTQSTGPRLETPAEVRFLAGIGDIVGMTAGPEATIARESGICYATACFVANDTQGAATAPEIRDALAARQDDLLDGASRALSQIDPGRDCSCREAPAAGRVQ